MGSVVSLHAFKYNMILITLLRNLAYRVAQIHAIFSISARAVTYLFGNNNHPPQHLAYHQEKRKLLARLH